MTEFSIKKQPYDLSFHAGLAFVGKYLKRINLNALVDPAFQVRSGVTNSEIPKSYLALLCLGKNDFDAIENFRGNTFFMRALGLRAVPSSPTLRQPLDTHASSWFDLGAQMNQSLLSSRINGQSIDFGALSCGYTPVDLDTFAIDNGGTKKGLAATSAMSACRCACTLRRNVHYHLNSTTQVPEVLCPVGTAKLVARVALGSVSFIGAKSVAPSGAGTVL